MPRIRFAFVAMLAAFGTGLAACSGGGGSAPPTTNMPNTPTLAPGGGSLTDRGPDHQPVPQPQAPSPTPTPASARIFPTTADTIYARARVRTLTSSQRVHLSNGGDPLGNLSPIPVGTTMADLINRQRTAVHWEHYNFFDFGPAAVSRGIELNGIDLSKATQTGTVHGYKYAAIAFQGALEHSMFLFQGGVYEYSNVGIVLDPFQNQIASHHISIGNPPEGNDFIAGTWKGITIGFEHHPLGDERSNIRERTTAAAERHIVMGNVELDVTIPSDGSPTGTIEFSDWEGGTSSYPDSGTLNLRLGTSANQAPISWDASGNLPDGYDAARGSGQFYGPQRQEAGGVFSFGVSRFLGISGIWGASQ